jgi:TAT (twin-arginine translocation) pathway signal sequence
MSVSRRTVLKGAAGLSAAATITTAAPPRDAAVIVYDSRLAEARAFAARHKGQQLIDIAFAESEQWQSLRMLPANATRISGLTGWSDWVAVRGFLEERGLRCKAEKHLAASLSGKAHLFWWDMG